VFHFAAILKTFDNDEPPRETEKERREKRKDEIVT